MQPTNLSFRTKIKSQFITYMSKFQLVAFVIVHYYLLCSCCWPLFILICSQRSIQSLHVTKQGWLFFFFKKRQLERFTYISHNASYIYSSKRTILFQNSKGEWQGNSPLARYTAKLLATLPARGEMHYYSLHLKSLILLLIFYYIAFSFWVLAQSLLPL